MIPKMPIVDGLTSTKMIRSFEKANSTKALSPRASLNGRVPIIAVSATLVEKDRQNYIDAGFDAWILKPINFERLNELMTGIIDLNVRSATLYEPGKWEQGGWFHQEKSDEYAAETTPTQRQAFSSDEGLAHATQAEESRRTSVSVEEQKAGPSIENQRSKSLTF